MNFNRHLELAGRHAFLSASKYHWVNYDAQKLEDTFRTAMAAQEGTELHEIAATLINKKLKLHRSNKTLNRYVNDAIGYRMIPEQILFYSDNAFGTADAISFRDGLLRIHDLKTGVTKASMLQLEVYTAFFCLEYGMKPGEFDTELRIYQNDQIFAHKPDVEDIVHIMGQIERHDRRINELRAEVVV